MSGTARRGLLQFCGEYSVGIGPVDGVMMNCRHGEGQMPSIAVKGAASALQGKGARVRNCKTGGAL